MPIEAEKVVYARASSPKDAVFECVGRSESGPETCFPAKTLREAKTQTLPMSRRA